VIKKKKILDVLKYLLFFGAGILLFLWVYRGQKVSQIWEGLSRFNYAWVGLSFIAFLGSILFRAMRWKMLIEPIGYKPSLLNIFLSVFVMYLANTAVTRMGEVARCGILKKYEKVPFTAQLGTVLIERIVDVVFLCALLVLVLFFNWDILSTLLQPASATTTNKFSIVHSWWFWIFIILIIIVSALCYWFRRKLTTLPLVVKLMSYVDKFIIGIKSVFQLSQPLLFVLLTIALYGSYYLSTYFVLMAFAPTAPLAPMLALSVLAMGSVGMVVPVPGG